MQLLVASDTGGAGLTACLHRYRTCASHGPLTMQSPLSPLSRIPRLACTTLQLPLVIPTSHTSAPRTVDPSSLTAQAQLTSLFTWFAVSFSPTAPTMRGLWLASALLGVIARLAAGGRAAVGGGHLPGLVYQSLFQCQFAGGRSDGQRPSLQSPYSRSRCPLVGVPLSNFQLPYEPSAVPSSGPALSARLALYAVDGSGVWNLVASTTYQSDVQFHYQARDFGQLVGTSGSPLHYPDSATSATLLPDTNYSHLRQLQRSQPQRGNQLTRVLVCTRW